MKNESVKFIFLFLTLLMTLPVWADNAGYPRYLTTPEIIQHYKDYKDIKVIPKRKKSFTFTINDSAITRYCTKCRLAEDDGSIKYNHAKNSVCIKWKATSYPEWGCFRLRQTGDYKFELRKAGVNYPYSVEKQALATRQPKPIAPVITTPPQPITSEARVGKSITTYFAGDDISINKLKTASVYALGRRGWNITSFDDSDTILANLKRSDQEYKIIIQLNTSSANIGFVQGYESHRDNWLRNIELDMQEFMSR